MSERVLLDACVLYPTVMREVVLGAAATGAFAPLWSPRILEEWRRAALRLGEGQGAVASGEIAVLRARWPEAEVAVPEGAAEALWLPDPDDRHVLAAAIAGRAGTVLTLNLVDFPRRALAPHGVVARHPDEMLAAMAGSPILAAVEAVRAEAEQLSGVPWERRRLLKKARLPRLAKALDRL